MRINEPFAIDRQSEIHNYKPKFFIVSEGSNSEPQYFEGLNNSVISENITIVNILRDYATLRNSHPSFIIKMIKEFLLNTTENEITVLELINRIDNFIRENKYDIDIEELQDKSISIYKKDDYKIKKELLNDLFIMLFKGEVYKDLAENFALYFEAQNVTYSNTVDRLNIVIDRDKQNFKDNQYDEVVDFCKKYGVNLYVSNPTFEFWLMLHFPEVENEDRIKMYENKYIASRRYLEKRLHDICKYKKSQLRFEDFEPFIIDAIKREKRFNECIPDLKNELGSNVGLLISEMLKNKKD